MNQKNMLGQPRQGAVRFIGDADGAGALFARALQNQIGIGGFARL